MTNIKTMLKLMICLKEESWKKGDWSTYYECSRVLNGHKFALQDCIQLLDNQLGTSEARKEWNKNRPNLVAEVKSLINEGEQNV